MIFGESPNSRDPNKKVPKKIYIWIKWNKKYCSDRESGGAAQGQGAELAGQPAGAVQAPAGQAGDREEEYPAGEGGKEPYSGGTSGLGHRPCSLCINSEEL